MADTINELTLKIARYFIENSERLDIVSVSGYVAYLTFLLVNIGLRGQAKYELSLFLNCNFSSIDYSPIDNIFNYECIDFFRMEEFFKIGMAQSAIFYSKPLVERFVQIALETYGFDHSYIDPTNIDIQTYTIEQWMKSIMKAPIYDLLQNLKEELRLLIINAYFVRFKWKIPCIKRHTHFGHFTNIYSEKIKVYMIRMIDDYRYYNDEDFKTSVVFVALEQNDTYAAIVLPGEGINIFYVIEHMNSHKIKKWFNESQIAIIAVFLPRFKMFTKYSLRSFLEFYNISSIFKSNQADLTRMIKGEGYINDFLHVSAISVNESGSFTTSIPNPITPYTMSSKFPQFSALRPFIFYLYNSKHNIVLHFSVILDPYF
ncbi:Serpin I2 [Thelohanellus kitauei]|uniref:Serpin I2 n=1 Tax=Thelohanellus kitauei TaxID=669202 RepID=A0A0C2N2R2_THEKT|nr:Serpin I2 [Thelohanellus kitauei]